MQFARSARSSLDCCCSFVVTWHALRNSLPPTGPQHSDRSPDSHPIGRPRLPGGRRAQSRPLEPFSLHDTTYHRKPLRNSYRLAVILHLRALTKRRTGPAGPISAGEPKETPSFGGASILFLVEMAEDRIRPRGPNLAKLEIHAQWSGSWASTGQTPLDFPMEH